MFLPSTVAANADKTTAVGKRRKPPTKKIAVQEYMPMKYLTTMLVSHRLFLHALAKKAFRVIKEKMPLLPDDLTDSSKW